MEPRLTLEELATQMLDWVDENVDGLSAPQAQGLETEFKRLVALWEAELVKRELAPYPQPTISD